MLRTNEVEVLDVTGNDTAGDLGESSSVTHFVKGNNGPHLQTVT